VKIAALLCSLVVLAGCAGVDERPALETFSGGAGAVIAMPAIKVAYAPTDPEKIQATRYSPVLDPAHVRARTSVVLRERGATVHEGPSPDGTHVLDVSLSDAQIVYEGQAGIMPLKIVFTVFFFPLDVPNYFISSDRFALVAKAKWKLKDANGKLLAEGTSQGRESGTFGDTSRGWYFVGYLRVPQCFDAESWDDVAQRLVPGGEDALGEALALDVQRALQPR
jgi:hypothetical protein